MHWPVENSIPDHSEVTFLTINVWLRHQLRTLILSSEPEPGVAPAAPTAPFQQVDPQTLMSASPLASPSHCPVTCTTDNKQLLAHGPLTLVRG